MSASLNWQIIRKNSVFIRRQRGINKLFSTEKFNLKKVNSQKYNGLVNDKGLDIQAASSGKGLQVTIKKNGKAQLPVVLKRKDPRGALKTVKKIATNQKMLLTNVAMLRASQILRSQKQKKAKKVQA